MTAFYIISGLTALCAAILWACLRVSSRAGAAEANAEAERRQVDALKQSEKVKDETLARMADASSAAVSDTVSAARDRLRKRPPGTR